jgi:hypothetical protein
VNIKSHNCFVCGVTINAKYLALMVGKHIRSEHDMSQEEYYRKYSYKSGDENCSNCGVKVDFINLLLGYKSTCSKSCASSNRARSGWFGVNSDINRVNHSNNLSIRNKSESMRQSSSSRMKKTIKILWSNDNYKLIRSEESSKSALRNWRDNEYFRNKASEALSKSNIYKSGTFISYRLSKSFNFRSSFEYKFLLILEDSNLIFNYESWYIHYNYNECIRTYVPDFYVECDGVRFIIEIKPFDKLKDEINIAKFKYANNFCLDNGLVFVVITEKELFDTNFNINNFLINKFNDYRKEYYNSIT